MLSGYVRIVDAVVMRIMDGLMAIPGILLAIAMMALTKASVENVIIAISIPEIPRVVRLVRIAEFKRKQAAPVLKVTDRAFGTGWRMPIVRQE